MPVPLPHLDTRRWQDLVDEGRALIPVYASEWTNHNASDPGITLLELLAFLIEQLMYRANQIPERHRRKFLALVGYPTQPPQPASGVLALTLQPGTAAFTLPTGVLLAGRIPVSPQPATHFRIRPGVTPPPGQEPQAGRTGALSLRLDNTGAVIALAFGGASGSAVVVQQYHPAGATDPGLVIFTPAQQQGASGVPFRTRRPVRVAPARIHAVQAFDGAGFANLTSTWAEGGTFAAWGTDPAPAANAESQPTLYIGFDQSLPAGQTVNVWLELADAGSSHLDRDRLLAETAAADAACVPATPSWPCPSDAGGPGQTGVAATMPPHHGVRTAWEYHDGARWCVLDPVAGALADTTRSFTLSGLAQVTLPTAMGPVTLGLVKTPAYYLRCRMLSGPPDGAPRVRALFTNAVEIDQTQDARFPFVIQAGVLPPAGQEPRVGQTGRIGLALAADGSIIALAFGTGAPGPEVAVQAYTPATTTAPGRLIVTLVLVGFSTGYPQQKWGLPGAPISGVSLRVWTLEGGTWQPWVQGADCDPCAPDARVFTLDSTGGTMCFGDGLHGRVPPKGIAILATYQRTDASAGNLPANAVWTLAGADDLLNRSLLGPAFQAAIESLAAAANPSPIGGGADEEDVSRAAGRAATALYAHERVVELSRDAKRATLDQVDPARARFLAAPQRAVTLLDYERIALEIPGTRIARARAWANLDPEYPCVQASGTVSVIVVPELPAGRPQPTPGLLDVVRRYLGRRKLVGTRLVVSGPTYLEVVVEATIQLTPGADSGRVQSQVIGRLNAFLDPLAGGPDGLGWPFGRDVYRSEILQVIDDVPGVDHVLALRLKPGRGEPRCDNLCVGPQGLTMPGHHVIAVA